MPERSLPKHITETIGWRGIAPPAAGWHLLLPWPLHFLFPV
jgi:hypothetical protein